MKKIYKLLTTVAILSVVLIAGCNKDELWRNAPELANSDAAFAQALAAEAVPLGTAANFTVLGAETVTTAGASLIYGDLGVSPGSAITGFSPAPVNTVVGSGTVTEDLGGIVTGTIYAGGAVAAQAHNDAIGAYDFLVAQGATTTYPDEVIQLDGLTLTPGVYHFPSSANLLVGGTLTLDFQGNGDAQFIFQLGSELVAMADSRVVGINTGTGSDSLNCNVYWAVGSSATIDGAEFLGTVIAYTSITMTSDDNESDSTIVNGRMLALHGEVTMVNSTISSCGSGSGGGTKPCRDFVTGGGWIKGNLDKWGKNCRDNDKATFGISGGIKNGEFWGELSYNDHGKNGVSVKGTGVTAYIIIDAKTRQIEGTAKINGRGSFTYKVIVVDNGESGRHDTFSIELSNGYSASGILKGGNIQLHKKCDDGNGKPHKHDKWCKHNKHDKWDNNNGNNKEDCYDKDEDEGHNNCKNDNGKNNDDHGRDNDHGKNNDDHGKNNDDHGKNDNGKNDNGKNDGKNNNNGWGR